ncbi:MAG: EamA-like transporter family protein [Methanomassiliicoccales archaeon PtaU1.Bin124]|nr:MAG: EamA-like transporter family protein [Methanomassiliicoccales archaeon PtaU1.Bin124]
MNRMDDRDKAVGITMISSLMLGSSYVAIKMGVGAFDPFYLSAAAMVFGVLACFVYMAYNGTLVRSIFKMRMFWFGSLLNTCLVSCQYIGLTMTTASAGGLIIGTNVLFVAIFSHFLFKEGISRKRLIGLALGFLGLVTITTKWDVEVLSHGQLVGDLFMLGSALCIALVVIFTPRALKQMKYEQWTLGLHILLPFTLLGVGLMIPDQGGIGMNAIPLILYIGLVCTTIPTIMWTGALPKIGMVTSATVLMLESTFSVVLSVFLLGESLDAFIVVGALMTFAAIFLVADLEGGK